MILMNQLKVFKYILTEELPVLEFSNREIRN